MPNSAVFRLRALNYDSALCNCVWNPSKNFPVDSELCGTAGSRLCTMTHSTESTPFSQDCPFMFWDQLLLSVASSLIKINLRSYRILRPIFRPKKHQHLWSLKHQSRMDRKWLCCHVDRKELGCLVAPKSYRQTPLRVNILAQRKLVSLFRLQLVFSFRYFELSILGNYFLFKERQRLEDFLLSGGRSLLQWRTTRLWRWFGENAAISYQARTWRCQSLHFSWS
jgi:hypothetical protein